MPPRQADRSHLATIRQHFAEFQWAKPNFRNDDDLAQLFEGKDAVARVGDAGEFGQARYSRVNEISTVVWGLPEEMSLTRARKLLLSLCDGLWEIPAARTQQIDVTFHHGLDGSGREDYGQSKADTWSLLLQGRSATGPKMESIYNTAGARSGTRLVWTLAKARARLEGLLRDR